MLGLHLHARLPYIASEKIHIFWMNHEWSDEH